MSTQQTARPGAPSFATIAPLLDRLVELAERERTHRYMVRVEGWDDGDFDAKAIHSRGRLEDGRRSHERIEYDTDREAFVYGIATWSDDDESDDVVKEERVLEPYPCPVPVVD